MTQSARPCHPRIPPPLFRWGSCLVTVVSLVVASVAHAENRSASQPGGGEEPPGPWSTFVLASETQFRPPPPARLSENSPPQLDEIISRQTRLTPEARQRIAYWDEGPITRRWTEVLLKKIAQYDLSPVRAARAIALVHVAMSDAVVACWDAKLVYHLPSPIQLDPRVTPLVAVPDSPSYPSEHATVAAAAATVLSYLFPVDATTFRRMAQEAGDLRVAAGANFPDDVEAGRVLGARVGAEVVRRGQQDGSDQSYRLTVPQGPGYWKPPLVGMAADPTAGSWRPWILASGADVPLPPPPSPGSPEYQADIDAVASVARHLSDEQKTIARFWADGPGTITPAGHWLQIAEEHVSRSWSHDPRRATRALALVSVAMADAFIVCWEGKYTYWTARPNQMIPGFTSYIKTPPFPGYPSGHSTQSGAAAEVLAHLFPGQAAAFRTMAEEAAISRLYGGIHFPSDNTSGLLVGREVGRRVVAYASAMGADP